MSSSTIGPGGIGIRPGVTGTSAPAGTEETQQAEAPLAPGGIPQAIPGVSDGFGGPAAAANAGGAGLPNAEQLKTASTDALWSTGGAAASQGPSRGDQADAIRASLAAARSGQMPAAAGGAQGHAAAGGAAALTRATGAQGRAAAGGAQAAAGAGGAQAPAEAEAPTKPKASKPKTAAAGAAAAGAAASQKAAGPTQAEIIKQANDGPISSGAEKARPRSDVLCADLSDTEYQLYTKMNAEDPASAEKFLLQQKLSRISELASLLSNLAKSRHDAAMAIIGNMR